MKILLAFILIPTVSFSQKISDDSVINKWSHAIINIEARNKKNGGRGTGILLNYNNNTYIITARHVIENAYDSGVITPIIILIENYTERNKNRVAYDSNNNLYVRGNEQTELAFPNPHFQKNYIFSETGDLALINLSTGILFEKEFIYTLNKRGYKPISINDIDTICKIIPKQKIFALGFPEESFVDTNTTSPALLIQSKVISIPIISKGYTSESIDSIFFSAFISVYHGYSGGPVIRNNKLIGLVHGPNPTEKLLPNKSMPLYRSQDLYFIKSSLIMPLIRKMESEKK